MNGPQILTIGRRKELQLWKGRRNGSRCFLANDYGELIIANLSASGYSEISRAKLIEPTHRVAGRMLVWSHPAFANRSVYLRNDREILCYSLAKPAQ